MRIAPLILAVSVPSAWSSAIPLSSGPAPAMRNVLGFTSTHPTTNHTHLSLVPSTTGAAHVLNHCTFPIYLYVCGQGLDNNGTPSCSTTQNLAAKTGIYQEPYHSANNGRSIKISPQDGQVSKPILQLEYTNVGDGQVNYDLSEVDGNPFRIYGFSLTSSNAACFHNHCVPPATSCPGVFTQPTDGTPHFCPINASIGVTVCE